MAGVQIAKTTIGTLKGQNPHFNNDRRERVNHANEDIDKALTHLNYYLGANSFEEMTRKGTQMIKEYDQEHPPKRVKKDRKTILEETIWCPKELEEKQEEFFRRIYEEMEKEFPGCIVGGCVHLDEKHEYIDANTKEKKESLHHLHLFKVPYSSENGVNMKSFCTKAYLRKVNCICEDVARELGGRYHNGNGKHTSKEMKQLKLESEKALEELIKEKKGTLNSLNSNIGEAKQELDEILTSGREKIRDMYKVQNQVHEETIDIIKKREIKQKEYALLNAKVVGKLKKNELEELYEKAKEEFVNKHEELFLSFLEEDERYEELYEFMSGNDKEL